MTPLRKCPACGAPISALRPDRCEFCGSDLTAAQPAAGPSPRRAPSWFAALRASPEYARALAHTPSTLPQVLGALGGVVFGALFCLVPGCMLFASRGPRSGGWMFVVVALVLLLVGAVVLLSMLGRALRVLRAPIQRLAAVVLDKRTEVAERRQQDRSFYLTIEDETGRRRELATEGGLYGVLTAGDAGVAFVLEDELLEFTRITTA